MQAAWQRLRLIHKLDALEVAHIADPGRLRAELLREIAASPMTETKNSFGELATRALAVPAARTPEQLAAAAQIAAAKRELGVN